MYIVEVNETTFKSKTIILGIIEALTILNKSNGQVNNCNLVDAPWEVTRKGQSTMITNTGYVIRVRKEVEQ